jgi:hypothetical protein
MSSAESLGKLVLRADDGAASQRNRKKASLGSMGVRAELGPTQVRAELKLSAILSL